MAFCDFEKALGRSEENSRLKTEGKRSWWASKGAHHVPKSHFVPDGTLAVALSSNSSSLSRKHEETEKSHQPFSRTLDRPIALSVCQRRLAWGESKVQEHRGTSWFCNSIIQ